jgi:hypothetical protein
MGDGMTLSQCSGHLLSLQSSSSPITLVDVSINQDNPDE